MDVKIESLAFGELINIYDAMNLFVEYLEAEENTEVEKRSK